MSLLGLLYSLIMSTITSMFVEIVFCLHAGSAIDSLAWLTQSSSFSPLTGGHVTSLAGAVQEGSFNRSRSGMYLTLVTWWFMQPADLPPSTDMLSLLCILDHPLP